MPKFEKPQLTVEELSTALFVANEKLQYLNKQLVESNNALSEANAALLNANEQLLSADRIRNEMFANISHDLRSPLTTIKNSIEYLLEGSPKETTEIESILNLMGTRVKTLEDFINDIFLLATLESNALPLNFIELDIVPFLEEFFYECVSDSKYKKRNLILDIPENQIAFTKIDIKSFLRVLDNLFSNALKNTKDDDRIILSLAILSDKLLITVEDTGIGIKEENLSKIFIRSYKVDSARTPEAVQGFGLGLSITNTIIKQHHGTIHCESVYGQGSKFIISLPYENLK